MEKDRSKEMIFSRVSISVAVAVAVIMFSVLPVKSWSFASNNIPLDSSVYSYLEKLAGLGLISTDVIGIKPYSKAEAARLALEAQQNLELLSGESRTFAEDILNRVCKLIPREISLRKKKPAGGPFFDYNPISSARLRYVYLDGIARSYNRDIYVRGGQSAFGFIGGKLRPDSDAGIAHQSGSEGTPLLENNQGVIYRRGQNAELSWSMEGFVTSKVSLLVEPLLLHTPKDDQLTLQKGYIKIGGGGLELEVGRDVNWFGPGYRGALTLASNARNFDMVKLSSPEPLDVGWVKEYLGDFKYAFILSRFDETGKGDTLRRPYFLAMKLSLKPKPWFEIGGNFVRQEGGPGLSADTTIADFIFGGGNTNRSNSIAGIELLFRIPWLRNSMIYGEYAGEDSAGFWPFVESYVAGIYIPCLTPSGRDDFRFEFFYGNPMLYTDFKFPAGYVYHQIPVGHSQGGGTIEFFTRYSHWFSERNNLALEYFHTERGNEGRVKVGPGGRSDPNGIFQAVERKDALRAIWNLPLFGDFDMNLMYGWERIHNFDLVSGRNRTNQLVKIDLLYRY